jgi:hypothetical protein
MEYRSGFSIKPNKVLRSGQVIFTNGTNEVTPNQRDCEAYGYNYDVATRTCVAYSYSTRIEPAVSNESNIVRGNKNTTETGTSNTIIMGESNTTKGDNRNNIIIGDYNELANGVKNATILGNYGEAQRDGEIVFGGGAFNGLGVGYGQSSTMSLSGTTTDATLTKLFVNSSSTNTIIARGSTSSFQGYDLNVIGVRTGGSAGSGAANDRVFFNTKGIIYLKDNQTSGLTTVASSGTITGWLTAVGFSATNDMHINVKGAADMNISWSATLHLYELKV